MLTAEHEKSGATPVFPWTGERYVPQLEGNIALEHLHRYLVARDVAKGRRVLDIACGEGYGAAMLAEVALSVVGIDIDRAVVDHARLAYKRDNLEFLAGSCSDIPIPDASVDLVVSFETIEHHAQHVEMMREIKRVLRPDGVLVISSPEKYEYSVRPGFSNEFHVKELYRDEFETLLREHFADFRMYGQRIIYASGMVGEASATDLRTFKRQTSGIEESAGLARPIYLVAVASDGPIPTVASSLFEEAIEDCEPVRLLRSHLLERDGQVTAMTRAAGERENEIQRLNALKAEQDQRIESLGRTASAREDELTRLSALAVARDGTITRLERAIEERDGRIAELQRLLDEREENLSVLAESVRRQEVEMQKLARLLEERDQQVSLLHQAQCERNAAMASLSQYEAQGRQAIVALEALKNSRSWRITAPLRRMTSGLRRMSNPQPRCNLFSQGLIALFALPASFFHYPSVRAWAARLRSAESFFAPVLDHPAEIGLRLGTSPRIVRDLVIMLLNAGICVRRNGGLLPCVRSAYRIGRLKGAHALFARLAGSSPQSPVANAHEDMSGMGGMAGSASEMRVQECGVANGSASTAAEADVSPRVLVIDYRVPMPDVSAGERATVGILRDLAQFGFDVVFLPNDLEPSPEYEADLRASGIEVVTRNRGYRSAAEFVTQHGHLYSVFYVVRVDVAEIVLDAIRQVAPRARVLFHAPDLYFLREQREAEIKGDPALRSGALNTKERELRIIGRVDHTVLISPVELSILRQYLPHAPFSVFPGLYAPLASEGRTPHAARSGIFFLGGFSHLPNVDAVQWFVSEVWPLVRLQLPDVWFHIVGSAVPQCVVELGAVAGVRVEGYVKDLAPLFRAMRVGVAPLRFGAGIKGKVAMTLGAGIPCVCTSLAAEGMGIVDGIHARIADEPHAFAEALIEVYRNEREWNHLSENGLALVSRRFSVDANRAALLHVLYEARALPLSLLLDYCRKLTPQPIPTMSDAELVDVSIIVPAYNQWAHTRACLNSIVETCRSTDIRYELILADDCSVDETREADTHYPGLRIVRTPRNFGFLRNCNHAAKHARGRYILLLNNDTVVLPDWLSSLYELIEQDSSIAIVGSKLLYPDGTIQEAGAVLWNDGTAHNFGRGRPHDAPECNYIREVDYISGASILIRRSFWERVGGFDERYENAYCEDCDLAMLARAHGMRVVYQPASSVVHFEHQSYADQSPSSNPALQRLNTARMREKWGAVFDSLHLPATSSFHMGASNAERSRSPESIARHRSGSLNVLFFSPFPSHPANHGNRAQIYQYASYIKSLGHKLHFALLDSPECSQEGIKAMQSCWDTLDVIAYGNPMVADGKPIEFDGWYQEGLGERVRQLCSAYDIDVVYCTYIFQSKLLEFVPAYVLKVIDTHDKMGDRYEMLRANGQPLEFFSCTPEEEGAYLRRADVVIARRQEEAAYFEKVSGRSGVVVVAHIEAPVFVHRSFESLSNVGMVASANRINLRMTRECVEAIQRALGGQPSPFRVHIAGQVADMVEHLPHEEARVFHEPWVMMHGFVPDIGAFYEEMDLIVSPVTLGTGINVKTVQAMAYGMPLLTTVCGAKGIETQDPMHSFADLNTLARQLIALAHSPSELQRLADISRARYVSFLASSMEAMRSIFRHPKLRTFSGVTALLEPPSIPAPLQSA